MARLLPVHSSKEEEEVIMVEVEVSPDLMPGEEVDRDWGETNHNILGCTDHCHLLLFIVFKL